MGEPFWMRAQHSDGCWLWLGAVGSAGYGNLQWAGRTQGAHRVAWQLVHGAIPSGLCVLHRCDVRLCVRPGHLYLGTRAENSADMVSKGRSQAGTANPSARLTEADVVAIRALLATEAQRTLAEHFGVSASTISLIASGKRWRRVTPAAP